jgi:dihydrofolate synthase/folylpolyglutamate synthase
MNYQEAVDFIHSIEVFGSRPGLERISALLDLMENPQNGLTIIHVAGTNGKGSTSAMIANILLECGYKVGLFISPYLESFNERIQINNKPIAKEAIASLVNDIKPHVETVAKTEAGHPTQFEVVTAMGFDYFKKAEVDFVILEVGLGGTYDATNVVNPLISVITSIGLDHQAVLGDTLEQIAKEKAGIIKEGVPVVTGVKEEAPLHVIKEVARRNNASIFVLGEDFSVKRTEFSLSGQKFNYTSNDNSVKASIKFIGKHQVENASLAITAVNLLPNLGYQIDSDKMLKGLGEASWPGRLEVMQREPLLILDGAHNNQATSVIRSAIKELHEDQIIAVLGILADKEYDQMIKDIATLAKKVIITAPDYYRALDTDALLKSAQKYCDDCEIIAGVPNAVEGALRLSKEDDLILITGSLYTIGEARSHILTKLK